MHRFTLRMVLTWLIRLVGLGILLIGFGMVYIYQVEPVWLAVTQVRMTLPHLASEFHGYRIVQISDIHVDNWMTRNHLFKIMQLMNQQQPDLVVLTGDYVTTSPKLYALDLTVALSKLTPKDQTVAVLGNHDHWTDPTVVIEALEKARVTPINNEIYTLKRGDALLHIAGVDDVWVGKARLDQVLGKLPETGAAILLAHEPDFADTSAATGRFDLQLSGHSHGGQARIPFIGPPLLPPYGKKYPAGRYQVGDMIQYTNRGVGMVKPRIRFNCRPEITVLTLEAAG